MLPFFAHRLLNLDALAVLVVGVLTESDVEALAQMCEGQAKLKAGIAAGKFSVSLWRALQAQQAKFALTPVDRTRIEVKRRESEKAEDWS